MSHLTSRHHIVVDKRWRPAVFSGKLAVAFVLLTRMPPVHMLRKIAAAALVILTVLPFTAPFPTCDAAMLFGDRMQALPHQAAVTQAVEDGSHTVPLFASSGRMALRIRFVSQRATSTSAHRPAAPPRHVACADAAPQRLPDRTSLTALRI